MKSECPHCGKELTVEDCARLLNADGYVHYIAIDVNGRPEIIRASEFNPVTMKVWPPLVCDTSTDGT